MLTLLLSLNYDLGVIFDRSVFLYTSGGNNHEILDKTYTSRFQIQMFEIIQEWFLKCLYFKVSAGRFDTNFIVSLILYTCLSVEIAIFFINVYWITASKDKTGCFLILRTVPASAIWTLRFCISDGQERSFKTNGHLVKLKTV